MEFATLPQALLSKMLKSGIVDVSEHLTISVSILVSDGRFRRARAMSKWFRLPLAELRPLETSLTESQFENCLYLTLE